MIAVSIATVTLKTDRPRDVARFWCDLLGYRVAPNHSDSVMLVGDSGPTLLIQPSMSPPTGSATPSGPPTRRPARLQQART
ncbi:MULTISPECIES: VOC family protein [Arthrobacter]|uniref:Glyoxalase-like domain-containing protein n=1 Tax=Arthrobacter terricola TaxID=2547396 RepID=A0A4R5K9T5_9MICC|nr:MULTISPECIES: VOC family protein [Arthrobacter]MBT8163041.1 hypothetical protein [Arthrobacter sp. GN70]TDF91756.1 hypothetical protein E1809_19750 [Arthrobacter terricola]